MIWIISVLFVFAPFVSVIKAEEQKTIELSLEHFVKLVLEKSLNAQITIDNYQSAKYSNSSSRRDLLAPKVTSSFQASQSKNLQKTSRTITDSLTGQVSVAQPFIWGGDFSVSGSGQGTRTNTDTITDGEISSSVKTWDRTLPNLSASYKQQIYLFVGNQKWRSWKRNRMGFDNSTRSFQRELHSIEVEARSSYYDAMISLEKIKVEQQKLKSSKVLFNITKALVDAGKTAPVELTRAQISLKLDERRLRNAEIATQQTINNFKNLILLPEEQPVNLTTQLQYVPAKFTLKFLQDFALTNRLDLQNTKTNFTLAQISLKESKETNRPQLNTTFSYKYDTLITNEKPESWSVAGSLDWSLFDFRINALKVKQSKIALENAKRQLDQSSRAILVEVQNGYLELSRSEEQIADFAETRKQAENNVSAVRLRYERGLDRLIDMFDAESKLRELDLEYLNLLLSYNKARDRLGFLVGRKLDEIVMEQ